jgi:heat-inducible transcriptional repressor
VVELSKRQRSVLDGVVGLHIRTGEPVSSKEVACRSGLGLSAATIRNAMAELEETGFLSRSHPSAGCVPTDTSLRVYVESQCRRRPLSAKVRRELCGRIEVARRELVEGLDWVAQILADVTCEAGLAVRPIADEHVLEAVSLIPRGSCRVLAVVVTEDGAVDKRVVSLAREWRREELQELANFFGALFGGTSMAQIRDRLEAADRERDEGMIRLVTRYSSEAVEIARGVFSSEHEEAEVLVAGTDNLVQASDFAEADRLRTLINVLQDRARIVSEWRKALASGTTQVIIGRESEVTAPGGLGMVATLFFSQGRRAGAVGVVGPRRMDYPRIVPMVEFIGDMLTQMLDQAGADHA